MTLMPDHISVDPEACSGKPHIKGTRILVRNILGMLAGGYDIAKILHAYPELRQEDVVAAIAYAADVLD